MAYVSYRRQGVYCSQHQSRTGYPLLNSHYEYTVQDCSVMAILTESYKADTGVAREILYMFEVPPEASVVGFDAEVGSTRIKAIVEEKAVANEKYQQAIAANKQAWKLDKVNDEVFSMSLGNAKPDSLIKIRIRYTYLISSDTLEDSIRLTVPAGFTTYRPGGDPSRMATVPTAPTHSDAVTIIVKIDSAIEGSQILNLNCLSHHATVTNGFFDDKFKTKTPQQQAQEYDTKKAYVYFSSKQFLKNHFVLTWASPKIDKARCCVELSPPTDGKPQTSAFALTLVSNIELEPAEHEYIFLVDSSGSMDGLRSQMAIDIVKIMLNNLPTNKNSTFNIYRFTEKAWSVIPGGRAYDTRNVSDAIDKLKKYSPGGTNINVALATVLEERNKSKQRSSIIVITDGEDWRVTEAMQTIQKNAATAAANLTLLRVFVIGVGDTVSRNMCESIARAGSGATAYISESQLQDQDQLQLKSWTMINSINRAPIRVRSINWGMTPAPTQTITSGSHLNSRPRPDQHQLGAAAKGDNLPPPKAIQQAPLPGTMFWAVRSYWYAIIQGAHPQQPHKARIVYDIPGSAMSVKEIDIDVDVLRPGKNIHRLAARALIQTLEDRAVSMAGQDKYWAECEIIRLGKAYGLASSQTSFVATDNGVGSVTYLNRDPASDAGRSPFSARAIIQDSDLSFVSTRAPTAAPAGSARFGAVLSTRGGTRSAGGPTRSAESASIPSTMFMALATHKSVDGPPIAAAHGKVLYSNEELSKIQEAQDSEGAFETSIIEQILFPSSGIPAVPAFLSVLQGRSYIKDRIWLAICVIAFLRKRHGDISSEWATIQSKAEKFIKTTLDCIFNVNTDRAENILTNSLDDAESYF